jgi:hypothetical protein
MCYIWWKKSSLPVLYLYFNNLDYTCICIYLSVQEIISRSGRPWGQGTKHTVWTRRGRPRSACRPPVAAPAAHLEEPVGVLLALWTSAGAVPHGRVAGVAEPARIEVGDKDKRARPGWFVLDGDRQGQLGFRARWLNWSHGKARSSREMYQERRRGWGRPAAGGGEVWETGRGWGGRRRRLGGCWYHVAA